MPQTIESHRHHARILLATAAELKGRIAGEAQSNDILERLMFASNTLEHFAADLAIAPDILAALRDEYRAALTAALSRGGAGGHAAELDAIPREDGLAAQREIAALRDLAGRIIRDLSDAGADADADGQALLLRLGQLDFDWLTRFDAAKNRASLAGSADDDGAAAPAHALTPETVTAYLRRHFPKSPGIEAVSVSTVPGGRSKRTTAITLANTDELPERLIMRQDFILKYAGQSVRNEVGPLGLLDRIGLPVPTPLHYQPEETELGGPFFFTHRAAGAPGGTYFGPSMACPGAIADLAVALAKLHTTPPEQAGMAIPDGDPRSLVRALIDRYWDIWRRNTTRGSALIDFAFAHARQLTDLPYEGTPTLVHGDAGGYNWLVADDRLTVILDWEFLHVGDPAEDLGVMRAFVEAAMPWEDFIAMYRAAGGPEIPEARIELAELLQWLKGTTLVATSARNFAEGGTHDFIKATNSFVGLRMIEMKIARALEQSLGTSGG